MGASEHPMREHAQTITRLLLGAAYADKRLAGAEIARIRAVLANLLGGELSPAIDELIAGFSPAAFHAERSAEALAQLSAADKRTVLELVASVNAADDELDLAEDAYLRRVARGLGLAEADFADLALDVREETELRGLLA